MVIIPASTFNSGGENSVTINIIREYKLFGETISKLVAKQPVLIDLDAYYIDKKEVTNAEYNTFLENVILHQRKVKKHFHPDAPKNKNYKPEFVNEQELNDPEQPVVGIDWFDAYAFCSWNGKRLPTEDEWKKAAKGKDNYLYPWGNTFESSYFQQSMDKPAKVISNKRDCSTYGLFDMASNVSEWTESIDVYGKNIICGTSYEKNDLLRVYSLIFMDTRQNKEYRSKTTGFRCALSIPK
jgi:formylglycine-generating enzyme required for sulfatase activity